MPHLWITPCRYDTSRMGEASMSAASYRLTRDKRHSDWVTKVEYFADLNFMISSSLDGTLKMWDASAGTLVKSEETGTRAYPLHSALSVDRKIILGRAFVRSDGHRVIFLGRLVARRTKASR